MNKFKSYIGTSSYYKRLSKIAIPLMASELLSSAMGVVDTIMVSSIGMVTAVGNANNVMSLAHMVGWGILSGVAAFSAQFFGAKQNDNLSKTFGLSMTLSLLFGLVMIVSVFLFGEKMLLFYLNDPEIMRYSLTYLKVTVLALIPLSFGWTASIIYRSMGQTKLTFIVSTSAGLANVFFNYLFIFVFKIGVAGAAYGTLLADTLMSICYLIITIKQRPPFISKPSIMLNFDIKFLSAVFSKTWPVLLNEALFGFGMTLINKAFGMLGTRAMDAYYVALEVFNLFTFSIWGLGNAVSIVIGQKLGEGDVEEAKNMGRYNISFSFVLGAVQSIIVVICAPIVLKLFNVSDSTTALWAKQLLYVFAFKLFARNLNYTMFSTLKAGGDSLILNVYDAGIQYVFGVVISFIAVYLNVGNIVLVVLIEQIEQVVRFFLVFKRYRSGVWANDLTKLVI